MPLPDKGKKQKGKKFYQKVAWYGILVALAMVLAYLEAQLPIAIFVPGVKLGLTNLVVLTALYCMGERDACIINLVRILLTGVTFGNSYSMLYSLAGGFLSCFVMILLKKTGKFSIVGVSVAGGVGHNIGQLLVAMAVLANTGLRYYFPILLLSGVAAGVVIGILGGELVKRLPKEEEL